MHFLIDGHNLIGKMPGLKLSDSQDELELILRLKGWVAAARNRQVTIYFDGSGLGGYSQRLSSKDIRVIFAPTDKEADDLLIARLNTLRNGRHYTLVTSDNKIINVAKIGGIKVLKSEAFVEREGFDYHKEKQEEKSAVFSDIPEKDHNPVISDAEVQEWLDLFGPVPERKPPPPKRKKAAAPPPKPQRKGTLATPLDRENPELEDVDLDAWLALFGGEKKEGGRKTAVSSSRSKSKSKQKSAKSKSPKENPHGLSKKDLDDWLSYLGED